MGLWIYNRPTKKGIVCAIKPATSFVCKSKIRTPLNQDIDLPKFELHLLFFFNTLFCSVLQEIYGYGMESTEIDF
jgi:hypothetical protein